MSNSINQLYLLCIFTLSGFLIRILFDIFRILRKSFKTPDFITYIEDFIFWSLTGIYLLFIIFKFSFGEIRIFMFAGLIIGFIVYMVTLSKYFISINVKIITFLKNLILKILRVIAFPFITLYKFLKRLLFKPITFMTINIMGILKKFVNKLNFFNKNTKNTSQKKDFPV